MVCRQRELAGDTVRAREIVLSRAEGLIRDCCYAIRLYDPSMLNGLLEERGFGEVQIHTDFSPHTRRGDFGCMNHRIIAVGRKPG